MGNHESTPQTAPLRIVTAVDVTPGVVPNDEFPENEAITRKVLTQPVFTQPVRTQPTRTQPVRTQSVPAQPVFTPPSLQYQTGVKESSLSRKIFITAAVVVGLATVVGAAIGWKVSNAPASKQAAAVAALPHVKSDERPQPSTIPVPGKTAPSETIHLEVTVKPTTASLILDNNAVVGSQLQAEIPKDQRIHVISASAPGYLPVNQVVTFSNDIRLEIELHRVKGKGQGAAKAKSDLTPKFVSSPQVDESNMKMERPAHRRPTKKIDESDPYAP